MRTALCKSASGNLLYSAGSLAQRSVTVLERQDGEVGWEEAEEGRDLCIHITESLHCTAETNTTF